jgi:hypothetical protein
MSETGQKPALPCRSIDDRVHDKQTLTKRVQCDIMCQSGPLHCSKKRPYSITSAGGADITARLICQCLSERPAQQWPAEKQIL